MRPGYEGYGKLLRRVAESKPSELSLAHQPGETERPHVRGRQPSARCASLRLAGLETSACEQILGERGVVGSEQERERLIEWYGSNPLALKIVAQTIVELFGGEIAPFLEQGEVVFGGVRELLAEQFDRLSAGTNRARSYGWRSCASRSPLEELLDVQGIPSPRVQVLEALEALRRRSLIEPGKLPGSFTLQSVVLEYATARLIEDATREIEQGTLVRLIEHGLELGTAWEYIRQANKRLLVAPVLERLRSAYPEPRRVGGAAHQDVGPASQAVYLYSGLRTEEHAEAAAGAARAPARPGPFASLHSRGGSARASRCRMRNLAGATSRDTLFTGTFRYHHNNRHKPRWEVLGCGEPTGRIAGMAGRRPDPLPRLAGPYGPDLHHRIQSRWAYPGHRGLGWIGQGMGCGARHPALDGIASR